MSIIKVSALYVQKNTIYRQLGVDCWDEARDARLFPGGNPVIAHPPCRLWSRMKQLSTAPIQEKELSILAINQVRANGGILEHPRTSGLWPAFLPLPGLRDIYGGYTICVNQHWWGHRAEKKTFLYIVGVAEKDLPGIPLNFDAVTHKVGSNDSSRKKNGLQPSVLKSIHKREASATPIEFAKFLIETAKRCKK